MILPAIDLKEGKAVRLLQGRMEDSTVYSESPLEVARSFAQKGAEYLHMVDLDGAFAGKPVNDEAIKAIVQNVSIKVEIGGGIRTLERIEELLKIGVERVVLGTVAVRQPELVVEAVRRWGDQVVVGIDAKDGFVAVQGWAEATEITAVELGREMRKVGVSRVIYTDISRDGMMQGPNVESTARMARDTGLKIIASGGISSLDDLRKLKAIRPQGGFIEGAIMGKALYAKAFTLEEALKVAQEPV